MRHYNFIIKYYDHEAKGWQISITPYKYKKDAVRELERHATYLLKKKDLRGIDASGVIYQVLRQG